MATQRGRPSGSVVCNAHALVTTIYSMYVRTMSSWFWNYFVHAVEVRSGTMVVAVYKPGCIFGIRFIFPLYWRWLRREVGCNGPCHIWYELSRTQYCLIRSASKTYPWPEQRAPRPNSLRAACWCRAGIETRDITPLVRAYQGPQNDFHGLLVRANTVVPDMDTHDKLLIATNHGYRCYGEDDILDLSRRQPR